MDSIIDERFGRVESALATLITSISNYNPTPAHANNLVAADASLSEGLEQLSTHQANYSKILNLRATSNDLDTQIRETLILLTKTRSELIATSSTTYPTSTNAVSYSELLSYARRISKFTLPPNYREPSAQSTPEEAETVAATPKDSKSETQTNGTTTPVPVTNGVGQEAQLPAGTAMEIDSATPAAQVTQATHTSQDTTVTENTALWAHHLRPQTEGMFTPWPTEETIRRGALASIQILVDQGVDPATFDPEKSAELEAERKRIVEAEDRLREQDRARVEEEHRKEMERRMSVSGPPAGEKREQPKVFQLETFDDDDDED